MRLRSFIPPLLIGLLAAVIAVYVTSASALELFAQPQERSDVFHAGEPFGTVTCTAQTQ